MDTKENDVIPAAGVSCLSKDHQWRYHVLELEGNICIQLQPEKQAIKSQLSFTSKNFFYHFVI